ncbi:glucose-1-phosphate cytidylyltransferase [Arenicella chitinivorans]|uniref:Glucose-1-phosphate cytidylyltransferase n=1 Tax=Arenicella chitinivorans TaxID=1329800 RepID=A0A918VSG5_9GAMM|nr:sugar phosphate nucleotidyltransferase [Arenicella chitinivorans]GHA18689.1 glucose-1-phosphate cytidylyltransferase [Arenicella chitinivorans]
MIEHACILAGGRGTRMLGGAEQQPKTLMRVGGVFLLDHILVHLATSGVQRVTIAGGYKVEHLERHGFNRPRHGLDLQLIDTGLDTNTGGRVLALSSAIGDQPFLLSWSDAVSNVDFAAMCAQHQADSAELTLAAVHPPQRFGALRLHDRTVTHYTEKQRQSDHWVSGGYFVVNPSVLKMITGPECSWEHDVLTPLSQGGRLQAYRHEGDWQCMDIQSEWQYLNELVAQDRAFWPLPATHNQYQTMQT